MSEIEPAIGRRDWLRGCVKVFLALSVGLPFGPRKSGPRGTELENWLRRRDLSFLGNRAALGRLGAAYIAANPSERDPQRLSRLLSGDEKSGPFELRLLGSIARDWDRHDLAVVEGWVLARSEARICAAVHLMNGAPT